jgi:hypothetical protein
VLSSTVRHCDQNVQISAIKEVKETEHVLPSIDFPHRAKQVRCKRLRGSN